MFVVWVFVVWVFVVWVFVVDAWGGRLPVHNAPDCLKRSFEACIVKKYCSYTTNSILLLAHSLIHIFNLVLWYNSYLMSCWSGINPCERAHWDNFLII